MCPVLIKRFTTNEVLSFLRPVNLWTHLSNGLQSCLTGVLSFGLLWFVQTIFARVSFLFLCWPALLPSPVCFSSNLVLKGLKVRIPLPSPRCFLIVNPPSAPRGTGEILRSVLFWDNTQPKVVIPYRRFGTTYRSHLHHAYEKCC
jgi:hypothetical protein